MSDFTVLLPFIKKAAAADNPYLRDLATQLLEVAPENEEFDFSQLDSDEDNLASSELRDNADTSGIEDELLADAFKELDDPEKEPQKKEADYKYSCLMLYLKDKKFTDAFDALQQQIDVEDIYDNDEGEYGLETEPHITVLYGLHTSNFAAIRAFALLKKFKNPKFKISGVGVFENEKYDVLKLNVESADLTKHHEQLKKRFKFTSDYPDYKPHATLVYLKKDKGKDYVKKLNTELADKEFTGNTFVFSTPKGKKHHFSP